MDARITLNRSVLTMLELDTPEALRFAGMRVMSNTQSRVTMEGSIEKFMTMRVRLTEIAEARHTGPGTWTIGANRIITQLDQQLGEARAILKRLAERERAADIDAETAAEEPDDAQSP